MRLDELKQEIDDAVAAGLPPEYAVKVSLDGNTFFVESIDHDTDGALRIHLEE